MVGQQGPHHLAARPHAAGRQENKIEGTARQRGRERLPLQRVERVIRVVREVAEERGRGVVARPGVVKVPADNGRGRPEGAAQPVLLPQPANQLVELAEPLGTGAVVQVQVHQRQAAPADVELDKEEPLLAQAPATKDHRLRRADRRARQQSVAVAEVEQSRAACVDAEDGVREAGVPAQKIEVVKVARPARPLVNFLQGDDVRRQALQELGNAPEVQP